MVYFIFSAIVKSDVFLLFSYEFIMELIQNEDLFMDKVKVKYTQIIIVFKVYYKLILESQFIF